MAQISQHEILFFIFVYKNYFLGIMILRACLIKPYNVVQKQGSPIFMNFCGQVTLYPSIANLNTCIFLMIDSIWPPYKSPTAFFSVVFFYAEFRFW